MKTIRKISTIFTLLFIAQMVQAHDALNRAVEEGNIAQVQSVLKDKKLKQSDIDEAITISEHRERRLSFDVSPKTSNINKAKLAVRKNVTKTLREWHK